MAARLTFWGAAGGQVTGSMHLLEAAGARILLDAGLFQGHRAEAAALNGMRRALSDANRACHLNAINSRQLLPLAKPHTVQYTVCDAQESNHAD